MEWGRFCVLRGFQIASIPELKGTESPFGRRETSRVSRRFSQADARTRTGDPFITSEVLYQLSYVGKLCLQAFCDYHAVVMRFLGSKFCCTIR
jgi:hypothetical protein